MFFVSGQKHNQHYKMLLNKFTLWHIKLNIYIHKSKLFLMNSIYLVFSTVEMQKTLIQSKLCYKFFYCVWKRITHKSSKVAAAKQLFSSVCLCVIGECRFQRMFFYSIWYLEDISFHKCLSLPWSFFLKFSLFNLILWLLIMLFMTRFLCFRKMRANS